MSELIRRPGGIVSLAPAGTRRIQAPPTRASIKEVCRKCGRPFDGSGTIIERFSDSGALVWAEHENCRRPTTDYLAPWRLP
jgi:hypothetical protein